VRDEHHSGGQAVKELLEEIDLLLVVGFVHRTLTFLDG
jgi:hypothetical protein